MIRSDADPLVAEYNAMLKCIASTNKPDPMEIWDLMEALRADGDPELADKLAHEARHILP